MKRIAILTTGLLLSSVASLWAQDIAGSYTVEGSNPGGGGIYRGEVTVVKSDETYQVLWKIGNQQHRGTGILRDGGFAVVYQPQGGGPGIAVYQVGPNGALSGSWVGLGGQQLGSEVWNPRDRT
ncbi:hypothetical protein RB623_15345 [Mesorhizobium sp. LHD-90]|uniref:hypothetical protein n=1 Tax=Mesorhizobium sp. LHD-90 TaxID=3071414 RepID=UPI0027DEB7A8|nr:hypothetical protein [Mesorhizobium sp. LHD-90]MDQ6435433.1 hypothetical protein [Mesorhizobium sp. LHD-90]